MSLDLLLTALVESESSDLHLTENVLPHFRIHGILIPQYTLGTYDHQMMYQMTQALVPELKFEQFLAQNELDASCTFQNARLRINLYVQQGKISWAIRKLPLDFFPLENLGLPIDICKMACELQHGLVLVTGSTGSGKSTTLASIINQINQTRPCHVFTIEDPVEYLHENKKAFFSQREVGDDTASFEEALRRVLREDPDVVMIGEMRDALTMRAALTLAETGHLTFATLHTSDAVQTISRIIGSFSGAESDVIRTQLATTLRLILSQRLLPTVDHQGRVLASEILIGTSAIQAQIRENKIHQILSSIQMGRHLGMRTMDESLAQLLSNKKISQTTFLAHKSAAYTQGNV